MPTETFFNLPEEKRRLILDLAIDEFADNDYQNASISRLVARAGIAKGSFYQYFADKQDLYLYLLQLLVEEKTSFLKGDKPPDPSAGFFELLRWMFKRGLSFQFSNPRLAQIGYRAAYGNEPLPEGVREQLRGDTVGFFGPLVKMGIAQGDIDPQLDPDMVSIMVYGLISQLGDYFMAQMNVKPESLVVNGPKELDQPIYWEIVDNMIGILEHGLRPREREALSPTDDREMIEQ
ncbi:MAG: TetR/AcrR family transcriptional regulator [Chloroflexota bacterium]